MPVMSGLDALPKLRKAAAAAKIVVISAFSSTTVAERVLALGAHRYLEKGADTGTIISTIEQVVAGVPAAVSG